MADTPITPTQASPASPGSGTVSSVHEPPAPRSLNSTPPASPPSEIGPQPAPEAVINRIDPRLVDLATRLISSNPGALHPEGGTARADLIAEVLRNLASAARVETTPSSTLADILRGFFRVAPESPTNSPAANLQNALDLVASSGSGSGSGNGGLSPNEQFSSISEALRALISRIVPSLSGVVDSVAVERTRPLAASLLNQEFGTPGTAAGAGPATTGQGVQVLPGSQGPASVAGTPLEALLQSFINPGGGAGSVARGLTGAADTGLIALSSALLGGLAEAGGVKLNAPVLGTHEPAGLGRFLTGATGKLRTLEMIVTELAGELLGDDKPLQRLNRFVAQLRGIISQQGAAAASNGSVTIGQVQAVVSQEFAVFQQIEVQRQNGLRAALENGFTFELEIRSETKLEAVVTRLQQNGIEASRISIEQSETFRLRVTVSGSVQRSDPIVLDLNGNGKIDLTDVKGGRVFDITGDGKAEQTAFVARGDAFLALDRNGDGIINSGRELFGNQNGADNGLDELGRFDLNRDGKIDLKDPIFTSLMVFYDINKDGFVGGNEFESLGELGIERLRLEYKPVEILRPDENLVTAFSEFEFADGETRMLADVDLVYE